MNKVVFTLHDRETDEQQTAYSRDYHDEREWESALSARRSNVFGVYTDVDKYRVRKWQVTYTLIEDDV